MAAEANIRSGSMTVVSRSLPRKSDGRRSEGDVGMGFPFFLFFSERHSGDVGWWKATQTIESLVLVVGCAVEVLYRSILEMFFA